jgi:outer membrane lipoprotein-sorting protein
MRNNDWALAAGLSLLLAGGAARADEPERLKALVEEAIKAKGGEARLIELQAAVWKSRGTGPERTTRATLYGQLPDKFRLESERTTDGKTTRFVKVINGDRGWAVEGGKVRALTAEEMAQTRETFYHKHLDTTLLPLKDKEVELAGLDESTVEGRRALGLRVRRPGRPDLKLYFDKETKLLLKSEMTTKGREGGKGTRLEYVYGDYQDFDGIKLARKLKRFADGKPVGEVELVEFRPRAGLERHVFERPVPGDGPARP